MHEEGRVAYREAYEYCNNELLPNLPFAREVKTIAELKTLEVFSKEGYGWGKDWTYDLTEDNSEAHITNMRDNGMYFQVTVIKENDMEYLLGDFQGAIITADNEFNLLDSSIELEVIILESIEVLNQKVPEDKRAISPISLPIIIPNNILHTIKIELFAEFYIEAGDTDFEYLCLPSGELIVHTPILSEWTAYNAYSLYVNTLSHIFNSFGDFYDVNHENYVHPRIAL
jgi:hypothetical protein